MSFWLNQAWILSLVSASLCLTAAIQLIRFREFWSVKSLIVLMTSLCVWALGYGLMLRVPGLGAKIFWTKIGLTGISVIPSAFAMQALSYSRWSWLLNRRYLAWFAVVPLIAAALAWTNQHHHLLFVLQQAAEHSSAIRLTLNPVFWVVYLAYPFLVICFSLVVLVDSLLHNPAQERKEILLILAGLSAPVFFVAYYHVALYHRGLPDPTAASFFIPALLTLFAVFRYRLPESKPIEVSGKFIDLRFQVHVVRALTVVLIPTFTYFIANNFSVGWYFTGTMDVLCLATIILFAVLLSNITSPSLTKLLFKLAVIIFVGLLWVLCVYFLTYELASGTILWALTIPLVCLLAFGPKVGFALSLLFLLVSVTASYLMGNFVSVYFSKFGLRYMVVYLILTISLFYMDKKRLEFLGQTTRQRDSLLEAERRYRWATEAGRVGAWSFMPSGQELNIDESIREILGYPSSKQFSALADLLEICPGSDQSRIREHWQALAHGDQDSAVFEMPLYDSQKETHWFLVRGRLVQGTSEMGPSLLGTFTDITERKRAEEALRLSEARYRAMAENFPDGALFLFEAQGRFVFADGQAIHASGMDPHQFEGKSPRELFPEEVATLIDSEHQRIMTGEIVTYEVKLRDTIYENLGVPIRDDQGKVTQGLVIARDVTQKHDMENRLRQSQKMEAIGTLAGGIAHDFNNILAVIMGMSEMALEDAKEGTANTEALQSIMDSSERGRDIVRRIMMFSRQAEYKIKPTDINAAVLNVGHLLEQTLPKMIEVNLQLNDDIPSGLGDQPQIEQVLMNLCTNARDAMPDGGRLTISTGFAHVNGLNCLIWSREFSGDFVVLSVADTGEGIDPDHMSRIFDPFYTTKEVGKGTGLGLSTVFGAVKSFGGFLTCDSNLGQGTTFNIYLKPAQEAGPTATVDPAPSAKGRGETILVVDDEQALLEITSHRLESEGYKALTATSGEQALNIFYSKREEIDLVLLDLSMPGIGGKRCLQEMKLLDPEVKIIIATGYSHDTNLGEIASLGATSFLIKPVKRQELFAKIWSVLDK